MANPNIVNVTSIYGKTLGVALSTTLSTQLLACASNKLLKINSIIVSNIDGTNAADATISFYDGSSTWHIASTIAVPSDTTLIVLGKDSPIYLEESDQIRGGASANSDLTCIISYEELDDA
jgi:hypothetical protein